MDQETMPARGPDFQPALLESFEQHSDCQNGNGIPLRLHGDAGALLQLVAAAEAVAEAEAEARSGRSARMSMDRLRCRTATAELHRVMVIERCAQRDRFMVRSNDGEAGPSDVQGEHGGDGDAE